MKISIANITIGFIILSFAALPARAENTAGQSAVLKNTSSTLASANVQRDRMYSAKRLAIKEVLERNNSPFADSADVFIEACKKYNIDCYLLPAISGLESSYGRAIYPYSYNPFGWGGGYIMFTGWDKAIDTVGRGLRVNYMDKGALTIEQIARIYSESPTWAPRVRSLMATFESIEEKNSLNLNSPGVQL